MADENDLEIEDDLKKRRRKLIEASKTPRTEKEIADALKPFKARGISFIYDERQVTITRDFEAMVSDPNNNKIRTRQEVNLTVTGNLRRPIEDFVHDCKWLLAQAGSIQDAQKTISQRRA